MKALLRLILILAAAQAAFAAAPKEREETVFIHQNRRVTVTVPEGLGYAMEKDDRGLLTVRIADRKDQLSMTITFAPTAPDRFQSARDRKDFIAENFRGLVDNSVEKAMQFEELDPKIGGGSYCVFTDPTLVGKPRPSSDDFQYYVAGVKTWPGVMAVFSVYCQDLGSKEYAAALRILRESVHEKPSPVL